MRALKKKKEKGKKERNFANQNATNAGRNMVVVYLRFRLFHLISFIFSFLAFLCFNNLKDMQCFVENEKKNLII